MTDDLTRASNRAPARLYIARANDAVGRLATGIPAMRLGPDAREEFALEVAALMGRLEWLLSMLRRGSQTSGPPA